MQRYQLSGGSIDRHDKGHWMTYADAEEAIATARSDEREQIVRELRKLREHWKRAYRSDWNLEGIFALDTLEKTLMSSPAQEPKCTCMDGGPMVGHATSCPCYKPPEVKTNAKSYEDGTIVVQPKCTCHGPCRCNGSRKDPDPCDCYPSHPKLLEKLFWTDSEWDGQLYRKFNALVDAVNALRAKP